MRAIGYFDPDLVVRVDDAERSGSLVPEVMVNLHQILDDTQRQVAAIDHEQVEILLQMQKDVVRDTHHAIAEVLHEQEQQERQQVDQEGEGLLNQLNTL